jgi:hypothetical protein
MMTISESQARKMGMVRDRSGNWVASVGTKRTELVESKGGSNHGMAAARITPARRTHAQSLNSIRESGIALGMSEAEAAEFIRLGECRG